MTFDQTAANLIDDESRYRILIEAVKDYAIYMLDPSGIVASWNPGAERFKGYRADEIVGHHFSRFYTAEDQATGLPIRALETALREGKFEAEGWRVRQDGGKFWAYVVIDPIIAADGTHLGFVKITRDLTERKLAQDALRQSQEQFRLLVQGVTDYAIFMLDPSGRINSWNAGAQRIKGYAPDEIIGEHFSRFYTDEDRLSGEPQKALDRVHSDGRFEHEGWRLRKNGERFWAHVVIDPIKADDGKLVGFAKITRDITERREAAAALDKAREALFQSQKLEAIGRLTGGVAHDFNNLLMAIMGSLSMLRKLLPDNPRARKLLENAVHGAERGATLTKRMLAFARRQELHPEPIDMQLLVYGMTDLLSQTVGPAVRIETRFAHGKSVVLADANQLEMALLNLVVNARDAMTGGDGKIVISVRATDDAGTLSSVPTHICIAVADDGAGMDEATLRQATDPFFTTKGVGKGTGLGLSMVHGLCEQSGGRFVLRSKPGEGTTAELWLPIANQEIHPISTETETLVARVDARKILVVDDDPLVLMSAVAMLEDLGHSVIDAPSGARAISILEEDRDVQLIITDQAMPEMTGTQLIEIVRTRWPGLPIVLATGYAEYQAGTGSDCLRLAKPFTQFDLGRAVGDAFRG
ncbi:PAS domain S-box protein [Tardiphaga sp.]|jgi:PAS domain S-box-containing protein|uniref:PAS domain S-box protein n=1 Tax=Tardiphaga sp. TaxID=1926292 RepID=UPI0037DA3FEB